MKMVKLAFVLLALAVFVCATVATANAALQLPSMSAMRPVASITKLDTKASPAQGLGERSISESNYLASNAVKGQADKMTKATQTNLAQKLGKNSAKISLPGMNTVASQPGSLRQMPVMGGMNMPDWTSPGIIFTL